MVDGILRERSNQAIRATVAVELATIGILMDRRRLFAWSCLFAGLALLIWSSLAALAILHLLKLN